MIHQVNETFLSLIPKIDKPETFSHFRPIGLCNVSYKLVTKIPATRLKEYMPRLISQCQSSFVPSKQPTDNILIVQKVVHSMRIKKGKTGYMIIKVDLEKAYDRFNWAFIRDTLIDVHIPDNLRDLILNCISSAQMSLLWNEG